MADKGFLEREMRRLTDEGKLIEAGWFGLRIAAISPNAPALQLEEMRSAFFAGAAHLFHSLMIVMEPGAVETPNDLRRMELIHEEMERFLKDFEFRHFVQTKGSS